MNHLQFILVLDHRRTMVKITVNFFGNRLGLTLRSWYNHTVIETVQDLDNEDTPSRAVLRRGDRLVSVNGTNTSNSPLTDVVAAIKAAGNVRPLILSVSRGKHNANPQLGEKKRIANTSEAVIKRRKKGVGGASSSSTLSEKQATLRNKRKLEVYRSPLKKHVKGDGPAPPSIAFQTDEPTICPQSWCTKAYGSKMAKTKGEGWVCRLAGSCSMEFGHGPLWSSEKCLYPQGKPKQVHHTVAWDVNGEPRTGCDPLPTVHAVYDALNSGMITTNDTSDHLILWSMLNLIIPDPGVFNSPLIRVVVSHPRRQSGRQFTLDFDVYFTRMVFYLIAFEPIKAIMVALTGGAKVTAPIETAPSYPHTFTSSRHRECVNKFSFTSSGLLQNQEHTGYRTIDQPESIALQLKDYQKQTVAWMHDQEFSKGGLNGLFWEKRTWLDSVGPEDVFYYMPSAGELRLEKPPMVRGGLLCEEMGLGKTLEMVCTIVVDRKKCNTEKLSVFRGWKMGMFHSTATLIIAPMTLISQWEHEIRKSLKDPAALAVHIYDTKLHGKCSLFLGGVKECEGRVCHGKDEHLRDRIERIASENDIILVSYRMLQTDRKPFQSIHWRRIVLDEMQEIRSSTTDLAKVCKKLSSDFRWMVSGTPLYTSLDDLNGELNFLGVTPFCLNDATDGFWGLRIRQPWNNQEENALDLLHTLLDGIMIRHSKKQRTLAGESILALPPTSSQYVGIEFDNDHDDEDVRKQGKANFFIAKALEAVANDFFQERFAALSIADQQRHGRTILNLMRLSCISVSLMNGGAGCTQSLAVVDRLLRARLGNDQPLGGREAYGAHQEMVVCTVDDIPVVAPEEALNILMRSRAIAQSRTEIQSGLVREGNTHQGQYDTKRVYAMKTILEKACESILQSMKFNRTLKQKKLVSRLRWHCALENITNGYYFARNHLPPPHSEAISKRIEHWSKLFDTLDSVSEVCAAEEAKLTSLNLAGLAEHNKTTVASLEAIGINRGQLIETLLKPFRNRVHAAEEAIKKLSLPGWRHKKGDRLWRGRFLADDFEETQRDRMEGTIKSLFNSMKQAIEDNRGVGIIAERQAALTAVLVQYGKNMKDGGFLVENQASTSAIIGHKASWPPLQRAPKNMHALTHFYHRTKTSIDAMVFDMSEAREKLSQLQPYILKMLWAIQSGHGTSSSESVEQNGFSNLQKIMEGDSTTCAICYGPVYRPTFTRCVHLACAECICSWLQAAPMVDDDTRRRADARQMAFARGAIEVAREKYAPCMLCRQPFSASQLVCVDVSLSKKNKATKAAMPTPASAIPRVLRPAGVGPIFTPAYDQDQVGAMGDALGPVSVGRSGRFPSLSPQFLTALYMATGVPAGSMSSRSSRGHRSPKVRKLLELICLCIAKKEKVVVFSQYSDSIKHLGVILSEEDVPHTKIIRGDKPTLQRSAVATFSRQEACKVFLLHAGAAAAGLTLTAAQHVILLEPFVKAGDEAQAFARCHRMGQTKHVHTYVMYMKDSIEERMLAYREHENQFAQESGGQLSVLSRFENETVNTNKLRFLLGVSSTVADSGSDDRSILSVSDNEGLED